MFREFIKDICEKKHIQCTELSYGWIYRLTRDKQIKHIFGHHFDGNGAAADYIASDKYACYTVLKHNNIPSVIHEIIFDPVSRFGIMDSMKTAFDLFNSFGGKWG